MQIKTLFISDTHLGSRHAAVEKLIDFLTVVKRESIPEKIYIVGDFIDGWKLKKNWYWCDQTSQVVRKLLGFLRRGSEIYYIAGNHDEFMREFIEDFNLVDFGNIHIGDEFVHEAADGKRYLVVHGDRFDLVTKYARWLCHLGDVGYSMLLRLNKWVTRFRRWFGLGPWSLSKAVKANIKSAVNFVANFEETLRNYSVEQGCDGCICGHIHTAALKDYGEFVYANTGDWVESHTAIYEDFEGKLHLWDFHDSPADVG